MDNFREFIFSGGTHPKKYEWHKMSKNLFYFLFFESVEYDPAVHVDVELLSPFIITVFRKLKLHYLEPSPSSQTLNVFYTHPTPNINNV